MRNSLLTLALLTSAAGFAGCGSAEKPVVKDDAKPVLSDADKTLVDKQKLCLVAGEPLGSMGTPIKVNVKGREVFLCCEGCRDEVLKHPDKYLARLDANGTVVVPPPASQETPTAETTPISTP